MSLLQMLVKHEANIATIEPHHTLKEGAEALAENKLGAIFVVGADGHVLGILCERDIIQAVGQRGAAALEDAVSTHMTWRCPKPEMSEYAALIADLFG